MLQPDDEDRWPMWEKDVSADSDDLSETSKSEQVSQERKTSQPKYDPIQQTESSESLSDAMKYASLGTELFAAVLAGTLLGWGISWLIERLTGYNPVWLIAVGVIVGALAGFLNMYRFIVEQEQKEERKKRGSK